MGAGNHGGFGRTKGSEKPSAEKIFTRTVFEGSVIVDGVERDITRRVYQRNDIDFNRVDPESGLTNLQRMQRGRAHLGDGGNPIQLHHVLQKESGPMAEVREVTHKEHHRILHGLVRSGRSFRSNEILGKQYANFLRKYWRKRAREIQEGVK